MNKMLITFVVIIFILSTPLLAKSPWLGQDKAMHFLTSAYLTYWNYGLSRDIIQRSDDSSIVFAVSLTTLLGTGKECSDKFIKRTKFSWHDMAYNTAGVLFGVYIIKNVR